MAVAPVTSVLRREEVAGGRQIPGTQEPVSLDKIVDKRLNKRFGVKYKEESDTGKIPNFNLWSHHPLPPPKLSHRHAHREVLLRFIMKMGFRGEQKDLKN